MALLSHSEPLKFWLTFTMFSNILEENVFSTISRIQLGMIFMFRLMLRQSLHTPLVLVFGVY